MEFRQPSCFPAYVARDLVSQIKNHVETIVRDSNVLGGALEDDDCNFGLFQRSELKLGTIVGCGGFSQVFEVAGFQLNQNNRHIRYSAQQAQTRMHFQEEAAKDKNRSKYVIKHIQPIRDPNHFCVVAADLCLEAQFLKSLKHHNILSIRGWSTGGIRGYSEGRHDGYFLLLDRLDETLADRVERWRRKSCSSCTSGEQLNDLLLSRTRIVHGISSALEYLHEKNMVFRDLKPDNVGFDGYGTVKIFDFGLARELPKAKLKSSTDTGVYRMSGGIGSVRYMAPEVALCKEYNQKVDTYSWAMIYWTCLTLEKPFGDMNRSSHLSLVCGLGQRPQLSSEWPESIRNLLTEAWAPCIYDRITMAEVCSALQAIEKELLGGCDLEEIGSIVSVSSFTRASSSSLVSIVAA